MVGNKKLQVYGSKLFRLEAQDGLEGGFVSWRFRYFVGLLACHWFRNVYQGSGIQRRVFRKGWGQSPGVGGCGFELSDTYRNLEVSGFDGARHSELLGFDIVGFRVLGKGLRFPG